MQGSLFLSLFLNFLSKYDQIHRKLRKLRKMLEKKGYAGSTLANLFKAFDTINLK